MKPDNKLFVKQFTNYTEWYDHDKDYDRRKYLICLSCNQLIKKSNSNLIECECCNVLIEQ